MEPQYRPYIAAIGLVALFNTIGIIVFWAVRPPSGPGDIGIQLLSFFMIVMQSIPLAGGIALFPPRWQTAIGLVVTLMAVASLFLFHWAWIFVMPSGLAKWLTTASSHEVDLWAVLASLIAGMGAIFMVGLWVLSTLMSGYQGWMLPS